MFRDSLRSWKTGTFFLRIFEIKTIHVVADAGKHRIHMFKKLRNGNFKRMGGFLAWEVTGFIKRTSAFFICAQSSTVWMPQSMSSVSFPSIHEKTFPGRAPGGKLPGRSIPEIIGSSVNLLWKVGRLTDYGLEIARL